MAYSDTPPNDPNIAVLYVRLLDNLDRPTALSPRQSFLNGFFGGTSSDRVYALPANPVTYSLTANADTLLVCLSGTRTRDAFQALARSYLNPSAIPNLLVENEQIATWARQVDFVISGLGLNTRPKVCIAGHSLGGAIGMSLARIYSQLTTTPRIYLSTFGQPKASGGRALPMPSTSYVRWTNPLDNVPRLPAGPDEAPDIYARLTRAQRYNLECWRHEVDRLSITDAPSITRLGDDPSEHIDVSTVLQAIQSTKGVFGTGHGLDTYLNYLRRCTSLFVGTPAPPDPPVVPGPTPLPTIPPQALVPAVAPPPPDHVALDRRLVAIREAAVNNDAIPVDIPLPSRIQAVKVNGQYEVQLQGITIAIGPTKKKARACARHLNRFFQLFQGVEQCMTTQFVYALASYLNSAADPGENFRPVLNNGGAPFVFPIEDD